MNIYYLGKDNRRFETVRLSETEKKYKPGDLLRLPGDGDLVGESFCYNMDEKEA